MENKTIFKFGVGIISTIVLVLLVVITVAKIITWVTFFIVLVIFIALITISFFLYYFVIEKRKVMGEKQEKKELIKEEDCENMARLLIKKKYMDNVDKLIDDGTMRHGVENTPIYFFKCRGEFSDDLYCVVVNRETGDTRSRIFTEEMKIAPKELNKMFDDIAEQVSSRPKEEIKPSTTRVMTPEGRIVETEEYIPTPSEKEKEETDKDLS